MSYDVLILVFLLMVFWTFMMIFVIKAMFCLFNSVKPEDVPKINISDIAIHRPSKPRSMGKTEAEERRKYETIMRNLEAYDGTGIGQEEVR